MAESTVVACPNCGKKYKIATEKLGRTFKCTGCETKFQAGAEPARAPAPPPPPPVEVEVSSAVSSGEDEETYDSSAEAPMTAPPAAAFNSDMGGSNMGGKPKTNGMAITSLVCGILGCIPFASFFAVLFGFLGLKKIKAAQQGGRPLAIVGIVLGFIGIIGYAAGGYAVYKGKSIVFSAINMQQIASGIKMYQSGNQQHYPPTLTAVWNADPALTGKSFVRPGSTDTAAANSSQLETGGHNSYIYLYPGPEATSVPPTDVLLYENGADQGGTLANLIMGNGVLKVCKAAEAQQLISSTARHAVIAPPTVPTVPQ